MLDRTRQFSSRTDDLTQQLDQFGLDTELDGSPTPAEAGVGARNDPLRSDGGVTNESGRSDDGATDESGRSDSGTVKEHPEADSRASGAATGFKGGDR